VGETPTREGAPEVKEEARTEEQDPTTKVEPAAKTDDVEGETNEEKGRVDVDGVTNDEVDTGSSGDGGGQVVATTTETITREEPYKGQIADSDAATEEERGKRVYVGNLAWEVSWQDLKDHMKSTGLEVARANIMTTPDGRSKGCGIVEFDTVVGAQQAVLTLNDTELNGRQIFVREDREVRTGVAFVPPSPNRVGSGNRFSSGEETQTRRVYVGNLSWNVAWQDLKDHMREAGEVLHAEVIMEFNGRSKGCGIVEYATPEEAQEAINTLNDTDLKGRMIFVREDRETASQGAQPTGPRGQNTSVYLWNLSPETSWQDLKDHMRRAGNVDTATILTNAQGESIGCGVVVYQRPQEAARAIRELQDSELNGVPISLREDRAPPGRGGSMGRGGSGRFLGGRGGGRSGRGGRGYGGGGRGSGEEGCQLYVGNLAFETTWRELKDHFRQCGDVKRSEVATGPGGQTKGFGTVQFFNKADAEAAISRLNGSELQGRSLEVRLDQKSR
jgi:RNA recognition motif-containing protein